MNMLLIGNDMRAWGLALALALGALVLALLARKLLVRALQSLAARTRTDLDDIALAFG